MRRNAVKLLPLLLILVFASGFIKKDTVSLHPMYWINGSNALRVVAGTPAILEMAVHDMNGGGHDMPGMPGMESPWLMDFLPMHMKYMHLVLIKKDLSHIAHVHPSYDMGSGYFTVPLNLPSQHPDNFGTVAAFPDAGEYAIFAEAKSKSHGLVTFRTEMSATENNGRMPPQWRQELVLDPVNQDGSITRCVYEDCSYQARLEFDEVPGCGGNLLRLYVHLSRKDQEGREVSDSKLEPWMMMGGHALLARDSGQMIRQDYHHLHATMPDENTPTVLVLSVFNRGNLSASKYRMWVQFKTDGKIQTVPFTFRYEPKPIDDSCRH